MAHPDPSTRRTLALLGAGALLSSIGLGSALTTAYAAGPAPSGTPRAVAARPQGLPAASPSCKPWQTVTRVPVSPRAGQTARATPATPSGIPSSGPSAAPAPSRSVPTVARCRNAPPKPFAAPTWQADSVVGGPRLAAAGVVVDLGAGAAPPPSVEDVSYVIADLTSGEVLAAKSPHAWLRPASTLKTLTALTLLPRLDPRKVVVASEEAQSAAGSRVGILAGNPYPVTSLVDAMLMFSANDAVYALADAAGGYDETVRLMNAKAAEIGAFDTLTVDPSGLDEGAQRSSAYDLALIGRSAMQLPVFRAAVVKRDAVFPGGKDRQGKVWPAFHIGNINSLLAHYPGAIGVKPGRTNRAQHTFIGAATRNGRTLLVTQMGSTTGSWKPTAALLDWGFANADRVTPVGRLVEPGEAAAPVAAPMSTTPAAAPDMTGSVAANHDGSAVTSTRQLAGSGMSSGRGPGSSDLLAALAVGSAVVLAIAVAIRRRSRRPD